jgi:rSAM/selenodomain-associated transferase 2
MITVIVPTLNAEAGLPSSLSALVPAVVDGIVREVIVVDGGSTDRSCEIADQAGATVVHAASGRGRQLAEGAAHARFPWLLFLHADTVLEDGWHREAQTFIDRVDGGARPVSAAAFRFALDDLGLKPRLLETLVSLRCTALRLPYGDQGLLLPKRLYSEIGGHQPIPLMEDVDIVRRLGRTRVVIFRTAAVTSAVRYRNDGYFWRSLRNLSCLLLYYLRVPATRIATIYDGPRTR